MTQESNKKPIILASQSPRRADLLRKAGIDFEIARPKHQEPDPHGWRLSPEEYAEAASYFKARSVADDHPDRLILAADTVVALKGKMFGKPDDENDARRILSSLMGTTHQVITGVTLYEPASGRRLISHDCTRVTMRKMSDHEFNTYLASREWEGKAGAYGIQDNADKFIDHTDGSFSNIVGLPMEMLKTMLVKFGIDI
ncbi:MAG: septum formation protein Maf [Planctomycetota bacterium]|nr:MAG: septum formation protein Maf [Planctomycetota bacterium]